MNLALHALLSQYDAVENRTSLLDTGKAPQTRWAASATASSNDRGGAASRATGASDVPGCAGSTQNAWIAAFDDWTTAREEWLEVTYAQAERATKVRIHETAKAPSVARVDLIDEGGTSRSSVPRPRGAPRGRGSANHPEVAASRPANPLGYTDRADDGALGRYHANAGIPPALVATPSSPTSSTTRRSPTPAGEPPVNK